MSLRLGETIVAGSVDLTTIKQEIYDGIYPVNKIEFGFSAPGVPNGVSATWTDVSSTYEGRYFKVSSTDTVGTSQEEQLPNITGTFDITAFNAPGGNYPILTNPQGAYTQNLLSTTDVGLSFDSSSVKRTTRSNFNASISNPIYTDGGAVRPLTTTIKVWQRTA